MDQVHKFWWTGYTAKGYGLIVAIHVRSDGAGVYGGSRSPGEEAQDGGTMGAGVPNSPVVTDTVIPAMPNHLEPTGVMCRTSRTKWSTKTRAENSLKRRFHGGAMNGGLGAHCYVVLGCQTRHEGVEQVQELTVSR